MNVVNNPHQLSFDTLCEELAKLPTTDQVSEGLFCAARLIQESAYAFALEIPGPQIVALIQLAAEVEQKAEQITKSREPTQLRVV